MDSSVVARLRESVRSLMPDIQRDLERLIRIPSISHPGYDPAEVRHSAEATADLFVAAGAQTELLDIPDAPPAVRAHVAGPPGAPTVLLYAHHDVQPTGPLPLWHSGPFEPVRRDGRLFGRGSSDDKCGVVMHAGAIRAWEGRPPVGITVLVEGEEEAGSPHLGPFFERHGERLRADAVVLADSGNWRVGQPALTTSLRGLVACAIEVRTLDHAVHSGEYGGPVPDALMVLARTLATLHDDRGNVAVNGLASGPADALDLTEEELRGWVGMRPGVRLAGDGGLTERLWTRPAISILGIDAPSVRESPNQLVPSARAKVSMRIPPGQDAAAARDALYAHLRSHVPWGAEVRIEDLGAGEPFRVRAEGRAFDAMRQAFFEAWGVSSRDIGIGGSIPFVFAFAKAFPEAALLLTGAGDPSSNAHSEDESVDLGELERSCLAEALFLGHLAG